MSTKYLKLIPEEIEVRIIRKAVHYDLEDKLKLRNNKEKMLFSLLINTHCAGCGNKNKVCLTGYVSRYCTKRCWKFSFDFENDIDNDSQSIIDIYEKYYHIQEDTDTTTKAYSLYHLSRCGKITWPMIRSKLCDNWCINNKKLIRN